MTRVHGGLTLDGRDLSPVIEAYPFSAGGILTVRTGAFTLYTEGTYVVESIRAAVGTAPVGAALIVDVNKNSTTIYTNQANRPTIAATTKTATGNNPDVTTFSAGDAITVDIDQVGSSTPGSDLTVLIRLRRVA